MSRYYSRDDVLKLVKFYIETSEEQMEGDGYYEAQLEGFEELQDDLFNLGTIDIVRCKECKYHTSDDECTNPHWDSDEQNLYPKAMEYDFCSYGEGREL